MTKGVKHVHKENIRIPMKTHTVTHALFVNLHSSLRARAPPRPMLCAWTVPAPSTVKPTQIIVTNVLVGPPELIHAPMIVWVSPMVMRPSTVVGSAQEIIALVWMFVAFQMAMDSAALIYVVSPMVTGSPVVILRSP